MKARHEKSSPFAIEIGADARRAGGLNRGDFPDCGHLGRRKNELPSVPLANEPKSSHDNASSLSLSAILNGGEGREEGGLFDRPVIQPLPLFFVGSNVLSKCNIRLIQTRDYQVFSGRLCVVNLLKMHFENTPWINPVTNCAIRKNTCC